jgi:RNA polymerase sigma factor (sigma-70 family)
MTQEEFKTLYITYYTPLYVFASNMGCEEHAHDIVLDVLLNIYNSQKFYYDHHKTKVFLYLSVKNKCIDISRKTRFRRSVIINMLAEKDYHHEIPIDSSKSGYTVRWIMKAITTLPKMQKKVLLYSYVDDLSVKEISSILGIAARTVTNHKQAAFKNLKSILCSQ